MFLILLFLVLLSTQNLANSQTLISQPQPLFIINNPIPTPNTFIQQSNPIYLSPPVNVIATNTQTNQFGQLVVPQIQNFLNTIPNQQIPPQIFSTISNFSQNINNNQFNSQIPTIITQTLITQVQTNSNYNTDLNTLYSNYVPQNIIRGTQPATTSFNIPLSQSISYPQMQAQAQMQTQTQIQPQQGMGYTGSLLVRPQRQIQQTRWPGFWNMSQCSSFATKFPVQITQTQITFTFCNNNKYNYVLTQTNVFIQGGPTKRQRCQYWMPPQQIHIQTAIRSAKFWTLNQNILTLKTANQKVVAILNRINQDTFLNGFRNQ